MSKARNLKGNAANPRGRASARQPLRPLPDSREAGQVAGPAEKPKAAKIPTGETLEQRRKRAGKILAELKKAYSDATCALHHRNALELLVATILSAQSTDETVNKVMPNLLARYPDAEALAAAAPAEVEKLIHQTGFFRQKTKSLIGASQKIVQDFGGKVPATLEELIQLPGVARKTANVVLGTWFGKNEGIVVDTHVGRLAHRLGLTWASKHEKDAVKIEQDLVQLFPRNDWTFLGHALIWHGRRVCTARKPNCGGCVLNKLCPSAFSFDNGNTKVEKSKRRKVETSKR